jgi:hypothetical protein
MICCLGAVSCSDDLYEPATRSSGYVNTVRKDGISFKLSLLNEEGKPATVFREGENISLHFEMENLRKGDSRKTPEVICTMGTGGFGKVFTPDGTPAYIRDIMCNMMLRLSPFDGENRYAATVQLYDTQHPPVVLPKGDYYTGFTYTFRYVASIDIDRYPIYEWVETGPVTMRIDFTVE